MRNGTKTVSSRPRGRPRSFDEGEVLDKACRIFMEKGFSATSLDDLSEATGLNRPSLYAAFGDKEQLYIAALKRYGDVSMAAIEAIMARKAPIAERVEQCLRAAINLYRAGDKPVSWQRIWIAVGVGLAAVALLVLVVFILSQILG